MHFDWRRFCEYHGIHYVNSGPNTARNNISVKCPMCTDDPSQHMGLHTKPHDPKWGCLRNPKHRGRNPVRLVRALLRCSEALALSIIHAQRPELDAFEQAAARLMTPKTEERKVESQTLVMPEGFRRLYQRGGSEPSTYAQQFLTYLQARGFHPATDFAGAYDLHYSLVEAWKWRLIIPFYENDKLVGWTGRTIEKHAQVRYLTLPTDPIVAQRLHCQPALVSTTSYVWNKAALEQGTKKRRCLVVTEGPMDALKLDWYNPSITQIFVTCCFGMPKEEQVYFLGRVARNFERVLVVLDQEAYQQAWDLADQLEELSGTDTVAISPDEKDPGALNEKQVHQLFQRWA